MACVVPFKGILYNQSIIGDITDVVTPPYDIISSKEQIKFYDRHPNNVIRLILGKVQKSDTELENRHTRAADYFKKWLDDKVLVKDEIDSFYITSVSFQINGKEVTRYGLIGSIKLESFEKGVILPHEKTFSKVKSERLGLMKACKSNFSPIFSLYSDQDNLLNLIKQGIENLESVMNFVDDAGHTHKLWRITDSVINSQITKAMSSKRIFIADGHHRYETALNYRQWVKDNDPDFSEDHPANYVLMYLCSMEDHGLIVLPAHRMLKQVPDQKVKKLIEKFSDYFNIDYLPFDKSNVNSGIDKLTSTLMREPAIGKIGVVIKNRPEFYLLTLKPNVMEDLFSKEMSSALRNLDVTVLTRLVFMELLGFDQARLDNEDLIAYSSKIDVAVQSAISGDCDISFILNPTQIDQVQDIAQAGEIMPRKTTYFYPKVITGQVMNALF